MICTVWDEFMESRMEGNVIWIATLNDDTIVYDDTDREPVNAWLRLREYCLTENKQIKALKLRFRSHYESVPNGSGYVFVKSILGHLVGPQIAYNIVGVQQDTFRVYKFRVPELILELTEERDIESYRNLLIPGL